MKNNPSIDLSNAALDTAIRSARAKLAAAQKALRTLQSEKLTRTWCGISFYIGDLDRLRTISRSSAEKMMDGGFSSTDRKRIVKFMTFDGRLYAETAAGTLLAYQRRGTKTARFAKCNVGFGPTKGTSAR
jgi:hypothetical protein